MHILTLYTLLVLPVLSAAQRTDTTAPLITMFDTLPWTTAYYAPPPYYPAPKYIFNGRAELSFVNTTGNTSTQTIGTAGQFQLRVAPWLVQTDANFVRSTSQDLVQAESLSVSLRASRPINPRVDGYGQAQYLRNTFAGLRHQTGVELGVSTRLVNRRRQHLNGELAFGYIGEDRFEDEDRALTSLTMGTRYGWVISRTSEFNDEATYTTNVSDVSDWRLRHAASITASLNARFSLKFSHVLTYLREPVPGFRQTDTMTSAAFVAKF
jgi:putative salt-induced outer membrane protein YdiY